MKVCIKLSEELSAVNGNSFIMLDEPGGSDLDYTIKYLVADDSGAPLKDMLLDADGNCKHSVKAELNGKLLSWDDENILQDGMIVTLSL